MQNDDKPLFEQQGSKYHEVQEGDDTLSPLVVVRSTLFFLCRMFLSKSFFNFLIVPKNLIYVLHYFCIQIILYCIISTTLFHVYSLIIYLSWVALGYV